MTVSPLDEALKLAADGIPCFPCRDDKRPATPNGFHDATKDPAKVAELWQHFPGTLIGVPTGETSGVDILDIDPRNGGNAWLDEVQDRLPLTMVVETRSGGRHFYFAHESGVRNSAGRIARGVDVRADGGYAIFWPAAGFRTVCNAEIADWPAWLLDLLRCEHGNNGDQPPRRPANHWAEMALGVTEGRRNDSLASLTGKLLQASFEPHLVLALLRGFNAAYVKPPLSDAEVDRIFSSIAKARMRSLSP